MDKPRPPINEASNPSHEPGTARRSVVAAGAWGAAAAALPGAALGGGRSLVSRARMPAVYLPHGGGPWPFVDLGFERSELDPMATYLRDLPKLPKSQPKALLVISAHWEEILPTVMTAARPPMLYDYFNFPPEAYQVTWPAPGDPALAVRIQQLLSKAGIKSAADSSRGFDHGTFVPMKLMYPLANIPTIQLSLKASLDPLEHLAIGRALSPLRDEGVFIVGSGSSFHNLRGLRDSSLRPAAAAFDKWLRHAACAAPPERNRLLAAWKTAPAARESHPREEHLIPLMVIAGTAQDDAGEQNFAGAMRGCEISGYRFG